MTIDTIRGKPDVSRRGSAMPAPHPVKSLSAATLSYTRLYALFFSILARHPYIRVVNYHETPASDRDRFEQHLLWYRTRFQPVNREMLDIFLDIGYWPYSKPGIIVCLDDGLRSNYDVAAPLLEKYGFCGWFFVPAAFIDCPVEEQERFARKNMIRYAGGYGDGRLAMSLEELRGLSTRHIVWCHTLNHCRLGEDIAPDRMWEEIVVAREMLREWLGTDIDLFSWVGGEEKSYSRMAAEHICRAGFRYSFMTNNLPVVESSHPLQLQRTNISSNWPLNVVKFQLCGILDVLYTRKRRRINLLTDCGSLPGGRARNACR